MLRSLVGLTLLVTSSLLASPAQADPPAKPAGYCAKIEQLLCSGPAASADPMDKMTIVANELADQDPAFKAAADRSVKLPPAERKKALKDELTKLEGKPFVCEAFDAAWDGREPKCPKAPPSKAQKGASSPAPGHQPSK